MLPRANFFWKCPPWTLKCPMTQFLVELWRVLWHGSSQSQNRQTGLLCTPAPPAAAFQGWKKQTPKWERNKIEAKVWIGKLVSTGTTENTCLERLGEISQTSTVSLKNKPQMFSTNSLILEMNICCQWIRGVMRNVKQGNLEPDKNQPDKPHWNQQEIVQFFIWTFQLKTWFER